MDGSEIIKSDKVPHTFPESYKGVTGLVSCPGSGNTWLRYLLQQATGTFSRTVLQRTKNSVLRVFSRTTNRKYVHGLWFKGCWVSCRRNSKRFGKLGRYLLQDNFKFNRIFKVLAVKTHKYKREDLDRYERIILLIRDPEGPILSEYTRINTNKSHVVGLGEEKLRGKSKKTIKQNGFFGLILPFSFSVDDICQKVPESLGWNAFNVGNAIPPACADSPLRWLDQGHRGIFEGHFKFHWLSNRWWTVGLCCVSKAGIT